MNVLNLPDSNSTDYPLAVKNQLELLNKNYTDEEKKIFRFSQYIPKEFFIKNPNLRGLLIAHAMGQGKTKLAVAIAYHFKQMDPTRQIIVLLPKSLEDNFKSSILNYIKQIHNQLEQSEQSHPSDVNTKFVAENFKFISLNASNMFKQISNIHKSSKELRYENQLGEFMNDVIKKNTLENSLLIIDEAHNLFNAITNGAKNAIALYDIIMKTENLKLLFLTGTPIINDPFELVPCFNMLQGYLSIENSSDKTTLFSESKEEFEDFFVDKKHKTIKNKNKFANRIYGLTSYYGDIYFADSKDKHGFPKKLETIIEKVPMSLFQFAKYTSARIYEIEESKKSFVTKQTRFSANKNSSSTYRIKTRQISNFAIPEYALGPPSGLKARTKYIDKITTDDLQNLEKYSPKMLKMIKNIESHFPQLGIVYSQFVAGEGLKIFARILETRGYINLQNEWPSSLEDFDIKEKKRYKFALITGEISVDDRIKIIDRFNLPENKNGDYLNLLLISSAAAEGIDLKRVRHVHIMEPFWNYARIRQVETRAIRYGSHIDLPDKERTVQVYIYLSVHPKNYPKEKITESTVDMELYDKSIDNMYIIDAFLLVLAETSIDCFLHYKNLSEHLKKQIKCRLCSPNHKILFHPILLKDMSLPDNCQPYQEKQVSVKKITVKDTDFYYTKDNKHITLYSYDPKLQGYIKTSRSHPLYSQAIEQIYNRDV